MNLYHDQYRMLHKLMEYISVNLDQNITLDELSRVAGYSKFHLGRIFEAQVGMTLGQYIRLQKLESGMMKIVMTDKGILDIALDSGYGSHASFTKQFKKLFGVSPGAFVECSKKKRVNMMNQNKQLITPEFLEIRNCPDYNIGYIRKTGNYFRSAPEAWNELARVLSGIGKGLGDFERFGISHDNPHEDDVQESQMRFDACINLQGISEKISLTQARILGGSHAVFVHRGPLERLGESFHYIYGYWILAENMTLRSAPPYCRYSGPKSKNPFDQVAEINIPVEAD